MITHQNGIFAQGTRCHYFLELDVIKGTPTEQTLSSLQRLGAPDISARGVNFVVAFGADLWRALAPEDAPADLGPFREIRGPSGKYAPVTQHDIWIWIHGSTPDIVFDHARAAWFAIRDVTSLADERQCFVYNDSRDLTGFIDGTANPPPLDAPNVALIPSGMAGEGGSHVLVMRWVHDLESFHALPIAEQEQVIGRTKPESNTLTKEQKHPAGHTSRVRFNTEGQELKIYRRSVPYGTLSEHGLYFVGFSAARSIFEQMLARMYGTVEDGVTDRITDFSRAVCGAYYFAPSLTALRNRV